MMRKKGVAVVLALALLGGGCGPAFRARVMTRQELSVTVNGPDGLYSTLFRGLYYCGSDDRFHYFRLKRQGGLDRKLKVAREELVLAETFPVTADPVRWVERTDLFSRCMESPGVRPRGSGR